MNKSITLFIFAFVACSSKTPVDMEEVLYDRSGQYITADNYNTSIIGFLYNQKVYNGPGFIRYRSGEKREQGPLKNGFKSGTWMGWDEEGKKKYEGEYQKGKPHGNWIGFHPDGKKKYEGDYKFSFQVGKWTYFNNKGIKTLEENYFICDEECDEKDSNLGKLIDSKKF